MQFPPSFLDELKARIRVSDVVGRKVKLQKRGREFVGLSPFRNEKTPSFTVNDDKGFYHCFSSGEHGDAISFLMQVDGLTFPEAVEKLAAEAGIEMPKRTHDDLARERLRASLYDVLKAAAEWFQAQLRAPAGAGARDTLTRRGVDAKLLTEFAIGFAPEGRDGLKAALLAKGMDEAQLIEAGLLIKPDDGKPSYDRFRNRIMFPITDIKGRVIAFGGRAMDPAAPAKYLNSPETPLFHKGAVLFNFPRAREASRNFENLIVVEGYMDVIALHKAGFHCVVAPLGTALSEAQIQLLWRLNPEPLLALDGDDAGRRAAMRAVDRVLPILAPGKSLRFAFLPDGKDPDDLIRDHGAATMQDVLKRSSNLADQLWSRELAGRAIDTPEKKAALARRFEELIATIQDKTVRDYYRFDFKVRLSDFFWRNRHGNSLALVAKGLNEAVDLDGLNYERMILGMLVEYPDLVNLHLDRIEPVMFTDAAHRAFFDTLNALYQAQQITEVPDIYSRLPAAFYTVLDQIHGDERQAQTAKDVAPRGHRFYARFPLALHRPPHAVIGRCLLHFLDGLHLISLEREKNLFVEDLSVSFSDSTSLANEQNILDKINEYSKIIGELREKISADEHDILSLLSEFFSEARKLAA